MQSDQYLRKQFLLLKRQSDQKIDKIMNALCKISPDSNLLMPGEAMVSQQVIKKLWDYLPEEVHGFNYESMDRLTSLGRNFLPADMDSSVILHFGWDVLSVKTTLGAAWEAYPTLRDLDTETSNICIYPDSFKWYVICAGHHLYPMDCRRGQQPTIATDGMSLDEK